MQKIKKLCVRITRWPSSQQYATSFNWSVNICEYLHNLSHKHISVKDSQNFFYFYWNPGSATSEKFLCAFFGIYCTSILFGRWNVQHLLICRLACRRRSKWDSFFKRRYTGFISEEYLIDEVSQTLKQRQSGRRCQVFIKVTFHSWNLMGMDCGRIRRSRWQGGGGRRGMAGSQMGAGGGGQEGKMAGEGEDGRGQEGQMAVAWRGGARRMVAGEGVPDEVQPGARSGW